MEECLSNAVRSDSFYGNSKHISDAALGLDDTRRARVAFKLASEAKDLHVDAAVEDILVDTSRLQQVLAAKRTLRCFEFTTEFDTYCSSFRCSR